MPPARVGRLTGHVERLPGHEPAAGARILLLDSSTNDSPFPAAQIDDEGHFQFGDIPPGWYHPIVEAGSMFVYAPLNDAIRINPGRESHLELALAEYPGLEGSGRPVRGTVRDAVTGLPIVGAWVSVGFTDPTFLLDAGLPPWESRTDSDGRFELSGVPIVQLSDGRTGLYPIVSTHRDHRNGGTGSLIRGEILPVLPISGPPLEVNLVLEPGAGERSIRGHVVNQGNRVAGVPVALTFADLDGGEPVGTGSIRSAGLSPRALVPGAVQVTDVSGEFEFTALASGRYRIHAAYLADDGWVPGALGSGAPPPVTIGLTDLTDLEIEVLPGIRLISPERLEVVDTVRPTLVWEPVEGARRYLVLFSRANSFFLSENVMTNGTSTILPPGYYREGDQARWAVQVYVGEVLTASSEAVGSFTIGRR
ncbi:MAG: carboxypeptidase-like regulatory domain-containing protein [Candidatus Eisenbacteria bacterium]|nr:carboxypeptidase-like regulatory domain-containing protein [Candidatus Eisenbacteria bacterium]